MQRAARTRPVYVDFDDVLCETALAFTVLLEREFGKRVAFEEIRSFHLGAAFGLSEGELQRLMELGHQPGFLRELAPVPGAIAGLRRWAAAGVPVWIVTGRPASTHATGAAWLAAYEVPYERLVYVDKYGRTLLPGGDQATLSLAELGRLEFSLAVEDAPQMAAHLVGNTPWPVAMLARPWNGAAVISAGSGRLFRCRDWAHLLEVFPRPD